MKSTRYESPVIASMTYTRGECLPRMAPRTGTCLRSGTVNAFIPVTLSEAPLEPQMTWLM